MPTSASEPGFYRVCLSTPCAAAEMVVPTLEKHLGLDRAEALRRLTCLPSVLCHSLPAHKARWLSRVLAGLGVRVQLEVAGAPETVPAAARVDLSVQATEARVIPDAALALAMVLPLHHIPDAGRDPDRVQACLAGPGGLIVTNLAQPAALRLRARINRIAGLVTSISVPETALYDLLPGYRAGLTLPVAFLTDIRRLGLGPCRLTGAVAARLNHQTCRLMLARYPQVPLIALNRDFQRFDLFVASACMLSRREIADFLTGRSVLPRDASGHIPPSLRIETGLNRANALAFQADYAALGLETVARLRVWHRLPGPGQDLPAGRRDDALFPPH